MKKISLCIAMMGLIATTACKNDKKEPAGDAQKTEETTQKEVKTAFVAKPASTTVKWTAYKTTDKVAVPGTFKVIEFDEKSGNTPAEALNNINFSIPVSSIFTKDETRDKKLQEFFFGAMEDTKAITGTLQVNGNQYAADITMNGVTFNVPLDSKIEDERRVTLSTNIDLNKWNALSAIKSLNEACNDLHKGPDGVSKTWEEVAIEISIFLRDK